jgi:hypothetical protein
MQQDEDQDQIVEGEELEVPVTGEDQASALISLEELIKNHIEAIDKLKIELKQQREMLEDSFNSNPTFREHEEKVKEVNKARNSVRSEIAKQPSVATIEQKVKDLRFDSNEKSKTLSDLLQDYREQTGATQIEMRDGKVLEIVSTLRLVRKSS